MVGWDPLDDFTVEPFTWDGRTFDVHRQGTGPAVVVVHEIPGITPQVARFARRVAERGFSVWMPRLFGEPGRPLGALYAAREIARACISREFAVLATGRSSPIVEPLRALCRHAHAVCGGPGVGAVGMCFTGNFALSLLVDPVVVAPVLSQPSLPFPLSAAHRRDLHVGDGELATIKARVRDEGLTVLGLRFTGDEPVCPAARFRRLREELGEAFEGIEIDSRPGNPWGHPRTAHSVLTTHLVDEEGQPTRAALDRVLALFEEKLSPPAAARG
jgi:dienelactone hydrolase